jgi:chorismate-pyruvate lyase
MMSGHVLDVLSRCGTDVTAFNALPPFLRSLLVTDGTVTTVLEAWFSEAVVVQVRQQSRFVLPAAIAPLGADVGETVLDRHVALVGATTGRVLATADSVLRLATMPDGLRDELVAGRLGIGELLRQKGVETCREIIAMMLPVTIAARQSAGRTYLIHMNVRPVIQVTERFPLEVYLS